jgi:hypothetical protein
MRSGAAPDDPSRSANRGRRGTTTVGWPIVARRLARFALLPLVAAALVLPAAPAAASFDCPGSFLVFQPRPAGPIKLPAGSYEIRVFNLSCSSASASLDSFIGDERLPAPWTADVPSRTFFNGRGSFSLSFGRTGGGALGDSAQCPTFAVLHHDRIGSVALPKGRYAVKPGGADPLSCLSAARILVRALDEPPGSMPTWDAAGAPGSRPARAASAASDNVRPVDHLSQVSVAGVAVAPGDVAANHSALLFV